MEAKNVLYRILHWAFIEIRYEASQVNEASQLKNNNIRALAHTLHNYPIYLLNAKNEEDYEALLAKLEEITKGDAAWTSLIKQAKKNIKAPGSNE